MVTGRQLSIDAKWSMAAYTGAVSQASKSSREFFLDTNRHRQQLQNDVVHADGDDSQTLRTLLPRPFIRAVCKWLTGSPGHGISLPVYTIYSLESGRPTTVEFIVCEMEPGAFDAGWVSAESGARPNLIKDASAAGSSGISGSLQLSVTSTCSQLLLSAGIAFARITLCNIRRAPRC